ncbi:MAG: hypothetical protein H0T73_19520 [Ardenticatenales bacterium]|nr:hypothetical protein [Ardenticatenales bacterium]
MQSVKQWMIVLCLGMLLLSGCTIPGTGLPDDGPAVPVSEDAAVSLEQKMAEAASVPGVTTVTMTQEEATSYLALRVSSQEVQLTEPQVYFRADGTVILRGKVSYEGQIQPMRVVARPTATNGTLAVDITEGRIGPVPVPGPILDQLEGNLAEAILAGQQYARLDEVSIAEGTLTLTGEQK